MPTITYIVQASILSWQEDWAIIMIDELTEVLWFWMLASCFAPLQDVMLTRAFDAGGAGAMGVGGAVAVAGGGAPAAPAAG
jgi:hypothetical protein